MSTAGPTNATVDAGNGNKTPLSEFLGPVLLPGTGMEKNSGRMQALVFAGNMHIFHHARLAMAHLRISPASSILVIKGRKRRNHSMILDLAQKQGWGQIIELDYRDADRIFSRTFLRPMKAALQISGAYSSLSRFIILRAQIVQMGARLAKVEADYIIGGIYACPLERTISTFVPHREFVLVDDGNMTRTTALGRPAEASSHYQAVLDTNNHRGRNNLRRRFINSLCRRLCRVKDTGEAKVIFYTAHDLSVERPDQLIRMQYGEGESTLDRDVVHILGMPVITRKIISPEFYGLILERIGSVAGGKKLFYFPHPAEKEVDLKIVSRHLPDAVIERYGQGYESELLARRRHPGSIYVCYSSAIRNVISMGLPGLVVNVIRVPRDMFLDDNRRQKVDEIYDALQEIPGARFIEC